MSPSYFNNQLSGYIHLHPFEHVEITQVMTKYSSTNSSRRIYITAVAVIMTVAIIKQLLLAVKKKLLFTVFSTLSSTNYV